MDVLHLISLGAGVQSSTMALMAAHGEIKPMPKAAIFADTQDESIKTMEWLEKLKNYLPFPVYIVSNGKLSDTFGEGFNHIPTYYRDELGKLHFGKRQCTTHFKINPLYKQISSMVDKKTEGCCNLWIGISCDEIGRMKPSRVKYIKNTFPLINAGYSRHDCILWLQKNNYPIPPKSSCIYCPYKDNYSWKMMQKHGGDEWDRVVEIDTFFNHKNEYLHRSARPLSEFIVFDDMQMEINLFNNECEGMCGV